MSRRVPLLVALTLTAAGLATAQSWQPPSGGAVEMFRQGPRPFTVGARSGGAGADPSAIPPTGDLPATDRTMTFQLAPVAAWDSPGGPLGKEVDHGTVHLYLRGDHTPRITAAAGEPVALPAGTWYAVGEAPGGVTTFSTPVEVRPGDRGGGELALPLMPACEIRLREDPAWKDIERIDLVSLTEAAVYPLDPSQRTRAWIPAGRHLAYTVAEGKVAALGRVESCEPGDRASLPPPKPPGDDRQGLIVEVRLPATATPDPQQMQVEAHAVSPNGGTTTHPAAASLWQGLRGYFFFPDLPADALRMEIIGAGGGGKAVAPEAGNVREVSVRAVDPRGCST